MRRPLIPESLPPSRRSKNSPSSVSLLPMSFALMVNEFPSTACIGIDGEIVCGVGCCCLTSETYGRNGVNQILRSFHRTASSTTVGWSRLNILNVFYIILSTTVSFLDLK